MVAKKQENKSSQDVESSKNGDLKSRRSDRTKAERRNLGIILGTLCVLAAMLAVLAIVIGVQKGNKTQEPEPEVAEEQSESEKTAEESNAFRDSFEDFLEREKSLLARDSVSAQEIIDLYNPEIEKHNPTEGEDNLRDSNRATIFIEKETDALISKGYKKEALEELTKRDYSKYGMRYRASMYNAIIDLATELDKPEIVAEYNGLLAKENEENNNNEKEMTHE